MVNKKTGPKPKYAEWMCDLIQDVAAIPGQYQAAMRWEIGKKLGQKGPISTETFARWREDYPEFNEAWHNSETISQSIDEKMAYEVAAGIRKGNATAIALLFNAKYKKEYKPSEAPTTTNYNLSIENLSVDELKYRIARSEEVLQKSGFLIEAQPE